MRFTLRSAKGPEAGTAGEAKGDGVKYESEIWIESKAVPGVRFAIYRISFGRRMELDAMYLQWGLVSVDGFSIDGEAATALHLLEKGPEDLAREIVCAIREQCGLTEAERKN